MKKMLILMFVLVFLAVPVFAFNSDWAGVTKDGVYYLLDDIVVDLGYGEPTVGWTNEHGRVDLEMQLIGKYWIHESGKTLSGKQVFSFEFDYSNMWFPHENVKDEYEGAFKIEGYSMNKSKRTEPLGTKNPDGGYNTTAYPVDEVPK